MLRFGSPLQIAWNILTIGLWLIVVVDAARRWRSGRDVGIGQWMAIGFNFTVDGSFIPIAPAIWLLSRLIHRDASATVPAEAPTS